MKTLLKPAALLLCVGLFGWSTAFAFNFPKEIVYKVVIGGNVAEATMAFSDQSPEAGTWLLQMKDFGALGIKSSENITTLISQKDRSLYANFVMRGNTQLMQIRRTERTDPLNRKAVTFVYEDMQHPGSPTNTITYTDYPVVDLLALLFYASDKVASGNLEPENLNLWVERSTKIVEIASEGKTTVTIEGIDYPATQLAVNYEGQRIFGIAVGSKDGFTFPLEVTIDDTEAGDIRMLFADGVFK